jgi:predicted lipoprotein with Yx(FWY)xxD motif
LRLGALESSRAAPNATTRQQEFEDGGQQHRPTAGSGDVAPQPGNDAVLVKDRRIERSPSLMTLKRSITFLAGDAALLLAALAVAGCGGGGKSNASSGPPKTASGQAASVGVSNASLGNILVNSRGRTLYLFSRDSGTMSECNGACAVNWPPLRAAGKPTIGSGAKSTLTSTSSRSDGVRQITYNGHPLYLFKGDSKPGDTNGEGLNAFDGTWSAVSPAGQKVSAPAQSSGGGGGY